MIGMTVFYQAKDEAEFIRLGGRRYISDPSTRDMTIRTRVVAVRTEGVLDLRVVRLNTDTFKDEPGPLLEAVPKDPKPTWPDCTPGTWHFLTG